MVRCTTIEHAGGGQAQRRARALTGASLCPLGLPRWLHCFALLTRFHCRSRQAVCSSWLLWDCSQSHATGSGSDSGGRESSSGQSRYWQSAAAAGGVADEWPAARRGSGGAAGSRTHQPISTSPHSPPPPPSPHLRFVAVGAGLAAEKKKKEKKRLTGPLCAATRPSKRV
jgi:hypothetical protein